MQKIWYRKGESAWYLTVRQQGKQKQIRLLQASNNKDGRRQAEQKAIQELATRKIDETPTSPIWLLTEQVISAFLRHSHETHEAVTS